MRRAQVSGPSQLARNLATNPSFETASGTVNVRTNLATNPSFEIAAGSGNVRTNLATNPSMETASGTVNARTNLFNWNTLLLGAGASQTTGVVFSGATWTRLSTTTAGHGMRAFANLADLVNGEIYEPEWELANDGTVAVSVGMDWCDSSYTTFTLAAGERRRCKVTGVSGITYSDVYRFSDIQLEGANTSILFREILIEKIKILGPYFDGATAAAGDFTYAWSGAANASTSYQQAPGVDDVSMVTSLAMAYQSKEGFSSGTKALRITATAASTDTFAGLWASAANTYVWKANTTYTIAGDRRIVAPQTGASGVAFRVNIGTELNVTLKAPISNVAGTQRVVGTFTTGASTALNFLRLYNGAPAGNGDVWWDKVIVEEGDTGGAYFDGATPAAGDFTYAWSATANASTSYQQASGVQSISGGNCHAIISSDWKLSGAKSLRMIPSNSSFDSFASIGGDTGGMRTGLVAGKTYTVSATCRLAAVQSAGGIGPPRSIVIFSQAGTAGYVSAYSASAPNAVGSTRLSVTYTIPTGATEAFIRLYNGVSQGNGEVWWDDLLIEEINTLQPYFDGANPITNLVPNPDVLVDSTGWSLFGTAGGTASREASVSLFGGRPGIKLPRTAANVTVAATDKVPVVAGTVVTASGLGTVPQGCSMAIDLEYFNNGGYIGGSSRTYLQTAGLPNGSKVDVAADTPKRWGITGTVPEGANQVSVRFFRDADGDGVSYLTDALLEKTSSMGPYFKGQGDFVYLWSGTANASTSIQQAPGITGMSGQASSSIQSIGWATSGLKSLRNVPTTNASASFPGGTGLAFGMQAGKTYTAMVKLRLDAPQSGTLSDYARRIAVFNGGTLIARTAQAPNLAGIHELRLTFTIPAGATSGYVVLYNGAPAGNDCWWDDLIIVEGTYTGPYVDGSKPFSKWDGVANASTSVGYPYG